MIWRGEAMHLTRLDDRRTVNKGRVRAAMKIGFIGQVSKWVSITLRTVDPLLVTLGREKGNELVKSFVRCLSPVSLKSLGPLAYAGSTPAPGTLIKDKTGSS